MSTHEPALPSREDGLVRVRLDLGYDGTAYAGWARQHGQLGVAQVLEEALAQVLRLARPPRTTVAGRTDAGVHARAQVVHVDLEPASWRGVVGRSADTPGVALVRRLRGVLPPDVRVARAEPAPEGFDARFSALCRRYAYRVSDADGGPDPLRRHEVLHHPRPLDVAVMGEAGALLLGEQDFAAFCRRREGATTVRTLRELSCARSEGGLVVITVVADAFCHSMVRALAGSLLAVGDGRRQMDWPRELLVRAERSPALTVAPARGLTLEEVGYPPDGELAVRARSTRRLRTLPPEWEPESAPAP